MSGAASHRLHQEPIDNLLRHCHRRRFPPKTIIVHAGDSSDSLYFIVEGSVSVVTDDDEGHELVLSYLNAGDFFGEMGLFGNSHRRSAWIKTRSHCEVAEISYSRFRQVADDDPAILHEIAGQMADRLRKTSGKVRDLAFLDVTGRIARTLMDLAHEPDAMTHPEGMQIRITRQELGRIVGCSREMVGRVLKELEEQGFISVSGKTMVIHNTR